jgi:phytoene synthase
VDPDQRTLLPGSDFYYATLYAGKEVRESLSMLEAFRGEINLIPVTCSDPGVARIKLAWWREEIEKLGSTRPKHEISRSLVPLVAADPSLKRVLEKTIDAVDARFGRTHARTSAECVALADELHGGLWSEYARICGAVDGRTLETVRGLGCWIEIGYGLRDFGRLVRADVLPISLQSLEKHGLSVDDLATPSSRGALRSLLEEEIDTTRAEIVTRIDAIPRADRRRQRVAVTLGHIVAATLVEISRDGYRVIEQRLELTPIRKLWTAWRVRISG